MGDQEAWVAEREAKAMVEAGAKAAAGGVAEVKGLAEAVKATREAATDTAVVAAQDAAGCVAVVAGLAGLWVEVGVEMAAVA